MDFDLEAECDECVMVLSKKRLSQSELERSEAERVRSVLARCLLMVLNKKMLRLQQAGVM